MFGTKHPYLELKLGSGKSTDIEIVIKRVCKSLEAFT